MKTGEILQNIISFLIVALIFIAVLGITFKITLKNYNVKTSKLKFYGLFLGMDNKAVLAFSSITVNYIFLIWCTATFSGMNIIYILMTTLFTLVADILIKEYPEYADLYPTFLWREGNKKLNEDNFNF